MKNILKERAHNTKINVLKATFLSVSLFLVTGCGEVDSDDGQVSNSFNLPVDSVLALFCPDAGIAAEPCILDDPNNPYATTPITDDNKFDLDFDIPSAKARFYLWATAQAMNPRGENQYHVAWALQQMYTESGSQLAREQSIKAYRSVLDNYFEEVWFFQFPDPPAEGEIFYPQKVRLLSVNNFWEVTDAGLGIDPLFDSDLLAWETLGEWGYTYDEDTKDVYRNF